MNTKYTRALVALVGAAALALPAASAAKGPNSHSQGSHGKSGQHRRGKHGRALIVKGTVAAVGTDGTVQVNVLHANHHGKSLVGQTLTFDVGQARIVVADTNGDGQRNLADVAVGDRVVVHARVAKGETPDPSVTITALRLIDQGPPAASDSSGSGDQTGSSDSQDSGSAGSTPPANG
jgi:hypothetical protein